MACPNRFSKMHVAKAIYLSMTRASSPIETGGFRAQKEFDDIQPEL